MDLNFLEFDPTSFSPQPAAHLFLFSDVLMISKYPTAQWVSKLGSKNTSKFHRLLDLKTVTVIAMEDNEEKGLKFLFKVTVVEKTTHHFCFQAAYAGQRQEFLDAVSQQTKKEESPATGSS